MEKSVQNRVLTVFFCGLIGGFFLLFWFLPKEEVSIVERRVLSAPPSFSVQRIFDGSFEEDVETYLADHFPFRRYFVGAYHYLQSYTGRNGESGIYRGADGYLLQVPERGQDRLQTNIAAINTFAETTGLRTEVLLVPSSGAILSAKLPHNHLRYDDTAVLDGAEEALSSDIAWIDITSILSENAEKDIYFKTDHHWTSYGAYISYCAYCKENGITPLAEKAYKQTDYSGFYGTGYAKSGLWGSKPDTLTLWQPPQAVGVTIVDDDREEAQQETTMFFPGSFQGTEPYNIYFDGNHSLVTITNDAVKEGSLLIIKDSYANAFAPFLAMHYHEINMIDLRFFHKESVSAFVQRTKPDKVLFLYSLDQFRKDSDFLWLK